MNFAASYGCDASKQQQPGKNIFKKVSFGNVIRALRSLS